MSSSCPVCIETFNRASRKAVTCNACAYTACATCYRTYVLSKPTPDCMSCHVEWTGEALEDAFTKVFLNGEYRRHRENVLLEREKSLLPSTMPIIEYDRRADVRRSEILELHRKMAVLRHEVDRIHRENLADEATVYNKKPAARTFHKACPGEDCRGFLSTRWICAMCDIHVCSDCHEIKKEGEEHTCAPENVETARLVARQTKACPNCAVPIFKIDGCDQIWCTNCHTAFSWNTLAIEKFRIHNPHYFEYLRNREAGAPAAEAAVPLDCDRLPDDAAWQQFMSLKFPRQVHRGGGGVFAYAQRDNLWAIYQTLSHIVMVELDHHRPRTPEEKVIEFRDTRIRYLRNQLTDDEWRAELYLADKKREKKEAMHLILQMIVTVGAGLLHRVLVDRPTDPVEGILAEFEELRLYFNRLMLGVSKRFNRTSTMELGHNQRYRSTHNWELLRRVPSQPDAPVPT
jgi:hypothetical protein